MCSVTKKKIEWHRNIYIEKKILQKIPMVLEAKMLKYIILVFVFYLTKKFFFLFCRNVHFILLPKKQILCLDYFQGVPQKSNMLKKYQIKTLIFFFFLQSFLFFKMKGVIYDKKVSESFSLFLKLNYN